MSLADLIVLAGGEAHFVQDVVQAWVKVMELGRSDLKYNEAA